MLMAGAPFASPPFKEVLLRSAASWSTAVVADILSKSDAVVRSVLGAQILNLNDVRVKVNVNVPENFAIALIKRILIVPYYVEMSLMRRS